jgi:SAM-dependent methyltransferase
MARTRKSKWAFWKYQWLANQGLVRALERARPHARGALLDVGCGSRPFAWLFDGRVERYWGTDLRSSAYLAGRPPDAYARAEAQPIRSGSMDTVLGLSVLTYLPEPQRLLEEAHRVLKPGGMLLLEFTQMVPLHDEPHDYLRFTPHGARWMLERAGFEPLEFVPVGSLWARVGSSLTVPLHRLNRGPLRPITELPVRLLYVVIHLAFGLLDRLFADRREVLAHLVVARRRP